MNKDKRNNIIMFVVVAAMVAIVIITASVLHYKKKKLNDLNGKNDEIERQLDEEGLNTLDSANLIRHQKI